MMNKINNSRFSIEKKSEIKENKILEIKNLHVSFKDKKVINDVSFFLKEGETIAIIGKNGSGKTVLMETIMSFIEPKSGTIKLNLGEETYVDNLKKVGIQYQDSNFENNIKVKNIIKNMNNSNININSNDVMEKLINFDINEILNKKVNKISGGQQQRLNLFLSVLHNPKLMILDEFITGLDIVSVRKMVKFINELKIKNNSSMIIVSHQPEEIEKLSDRILVLKEGKIILETTPKEVIEKYGATDIFMEEII